MDLDYDKLKKWEIVGAFWIIIVGSLLHFVYDWSNKSRVIAIFSPVNESLWEHLKLGYWALLFFMLIEYWFVRKHTNSFFISKTSGILAMSLLILIVFYLYTTIMKRHILVIDIGSFIAGAILCQYISFKLMKRNLNNFLNRTGFLIFILIGVAFIFFTFKTPHLDIFKDPSKGIYGIE